MADPSMTCTFKATKSGDNVILSGQALVTLGDSVGAGPIKVYGSYALTIKWYYNDNPDDKRTFSATSTLNGTSTLETCQSGTVTVVFNNYVQHVGKDVTIEEATISWNQGSSYNTISYEYLSASVSFRSEGRGSVSEERSPWWGWCAPCGSTCSSTAIPETECDTFLGWYENGTLFSTDETISFTAGTVLRMTIPVLITSTCLM